MGGKAEERRESEEMESEERAESEEMGSEEMELESEEMDRNRRSNRRSNLRSPRSVGPSPAKIFRSLGGRSAWQVARRERRMVCRWISLPSISGIFSGASWGFLIFRIVCIIRVVCIFRISSEFFSFFP